MRCWVCLAVSACLSAPISSSPSVFTVPAALEGEAVATLKLAALGFFIGQLQSYLNSIPQSLMRYDIASRIEMLFGTGVPLLTVGVLMLGHGLFEVILLRVVCSASTAACWRSGSGA
jgi:hypothetical protein